MIKPISISFDTVFIKKDVSYKNENASLAPLKKDKVSFGNFGAYSKFLSGFKQLNISQEDFIKICSSQPEIGLGGQGKVYNIPLAGLDGFVVKIFKFFDFNALGKLAPVKDDFPQHNFGQVIAKMGDKIEIMERIEGTSLDKFLNPENYANKKEMIEKFFDMFSKLPQKTFDNYVRDIKTVNSKGYFFDSGNPGNIILNGEKLNIIDLRNIVHGKDQISDAILPFIINTSVTNEKILKSKINILEKIIKATAKADFKYKPDVGMNKRVLEEQEPEFLKKFEELVEKYFGVKK